jgi:uncharacterized coiled-coil protein SlyX
MEKKTRRLEEKCEQLEEKCNFQDTQIAELQRQLLALHEQDKTPEINKIEMKLKRLEERLNSPVKVYDNFDMSKVFVPATTTPYPPKLRITPASVSTSSLYTIEEEPSNVNK